MNKIDLQQLIHEKMPGFMDNYPNFLKKTAMSLLGRILHIDDINEFLEKNNDETGFDFIDALFEHLNFSYNLSSKDLRKIPAEGKLIIVSNHPIGGLDGLALIRAVAEVRKDVKIVANDVLLNIENLKGLFIPFDVYRGASAKHSISAIEKALHNEEAVIFFPSGEVSRMGVNGIKDSKWAKGAVKFASKTNSPVLPVFIKAANSFTFYSVSAFNKKAAMLLLPHELFNKRGVSIEIKIGNVISASNFKFQHFNVRMQTSLLKKHTYHIGAGKKPIFVSERTIIHPVAVRLIKSELQKAELIGNTSDGKKIYLVEALQSENILKEIARLREITFRKVGEGTGKSYDTDRYDRYYKHIVLWDDDDLEIVGSYRLGLTNEIISKYGKTGLYNSSQFVLNNDFDDVLKESIEMGRSFVQQKYWGSMALDYMWQGIGAFLRVNPNIKYLWGAVSISDTYSDYAKNMIVYFYKKWYSGNEGFVAPHTNYTISRNLEEEFEKVFIGENQSQDFTKLKSQLKGLGFAVPVLYRRYTELCEYGGALFAGFTIDVNFNNSIDGLIIVDLQKLKYETKERYFGSRSINQEAVRN